MITIKFYRFIPTMQVVKLKKNHQFHNVFTVSYDHENSVNNDLCPFERARSIVHKWLEHHYGFCIIQMDNIDEDDKGITVKICNHKKFIKDMLRLNLKITIKRAAVYG